MRNILLTTILFSFTFNVSAKLGMVTFQELVSRSELIVLATPVKFENNKTTFIINNIFKGRNKNKELTISHSMEVHDQTIEVLGKHILFLLKNPKSGWQAASYGRSYWPLVRTYHQKDNLNKNCKSAVPYVYPFTMVKLGNHLKEQSMVVRYPYYPTKKGEVEQMVVCGEQIFKAVKHLTRRSKTFTLFTGTTTRSFYSR